ncbi:MAG: ATP-binding protein [Planctomycetes bacterium]|nr:ATP-binding protein [Planctomycetota bacterium]
MVAQTSTLDGPPDTGGGPVSPTPGAALGDPFQGSLADQTRWLISLRWVAVMLVVIGTLSGTYIFPVLMDPKPLYATALALLVCNIAYAVAARGPRGGHPQSTATLATVQMEVDLLVLTAALHFSGGVTDPFCLFYVFHVIIATIILPRNLSFAVGLTAIILFGLLAANELNGGAILGHYPLQLSAGGGFWRNPVYGLAAFVAFACTVLIAQYLTRMILVRMASKELEAAQSSNLLRAIINAMAEGLIFVTADGQVALCNRAAGQWRLHGSGADPDSVDAFPATLAEHIKTLADRRSGLTSQDKTIEFHTGGPTPRLIEARSCPMTGLHGVPLGYVIVGQDLTEHKRLEADLLSRTEQVTTINEMLKMSRVRMAQREKMVALGQMAAGIAHEIGNPLTSLSSVVQYLGRKCTDPEQKELCRVVDHHVGRISAILRRMLNHARPATSEYKWANVNEMVQNTLELIRLDKRAAAVTIVDTYNAALPMVWLNPQNLEQCLLNITINALDAMEAKGAGGKHWLEVTKTLKEEKVEIRISDTGVGMSPEVCRRAFESFFTTKEISKGTGLGLFVSYNLITEMDGTIELQSELGQGTTAIIRIPVRPKKDLLVGPAGDADHSPLTERAQ